MTDPSRAVFLSYASQDAGAAQRICDALRGAGIEVWFDQSELRGGEAWDQTIRRQIRTCALFVALISRHTHERREGYFRLEWKLAVDRSNLISPTQAFLLPVVIDDTREDDEEVPDAIRDVHWTRLPSGETTAAFVDRILHLLSGEPPSRAPAAQSGAGGAVRASAREPWSPKLGLSAAVGIVVLGALAYAAMDGLWVSRPASRSQTVGAGGPPPVFSPPPHSIAVLPFINMSGDKAQDYFSEGLSEELLDDLSRINGLQVAARTSAFSFQGKDVDIGTIARRLNVGVVLEGSVRRSGNTIRVTAQLNNAVTGFRIWSQTYDRRLGDLLQLQTDIAASVVSALKVTLLADVAQTIAVGATANPAAFDAYLRGRAIAAGTVDQDEAAITAFSEAIRLDPQYAQAFAERSIAFANYGGWEARGSEVQASFVKALADARKAVALAPALAEGHYALAVALESGFLDFPESNPEYERARDLAPGSARMLAAYSRNAADMGNAAAAIGAAREATVLDPLNANVHRTVGIAFVMAHQYSDAISAYQAALSLRPDDVRLHALIGETRYLMGDLQGARALCEMASADEVGRECLAVTYRRIGMRSRAEAVLQGLESSLGDSGAYDYATIYAQWGDVPKALDWLETALRLRDPGLVELKTEPYLDPVRSEPRFQAIERELKFPAS